MKSVMEKTVKATLFLNDGCKFTGFLFGSNNDVDGEIGE